MKKTQLLIVVMGLILSISSGYSQYASALPFLLINPSPTATAMGDVGVASNPDDAFNIAMNPAHLGGLSRQHNFLLTTNLTNGYRFDRSDIGLQFGMDLKDITGIPLYAGIGYLRQGIDLGEFNIYDDNGHVLAIFESHESSNSIALGASIDYGVEISLGLTYKFLSSTLRPAGNTSDDGTSTGGALDAGILFSIPILKKFTIIGDLNTDLMTNIGYSIHNMGDEIEYNREKDPLPFNDRIGYSISANFNLPIENIEYSMLVIDWTAETKEFLVNRDTLSTKYDSPFSNVNIIENIFLLNKTGKGIQVAHGLKLTAFEAFAYMIGKYENDILDYSTSGFEVSTKGIIKFLSNNFDNNIIKYVNNHLEIVYSQVTITNKQNLYINFSALNLRINNINF